MKSLSLCCLSTSAFLALSSGASAAILNVTCTATVYYSQIDTTDVFGAAGSNTLVGDSFVANFVFDTSAGTLTYSSNPTNGSEEQYLEGGLVSASVTIGGVLYNLVDRI